MFKGSWLVERTKRIKVTIPRQLAEDDVYKSLYKEMESLIRSTSSSDQQRRQIKSACLAWHLHGNTRVFNRRCNVTKAPGEGPLNVVS